MQCPEWDALWADSAQLETISTVDEEAASLATTGFVALAADF